MTSSPGPQLPELYRLFGSDEPLPEHEFVAPEAVPEPYRRLLVHPYHMTVTVEDYYGGPVNVHVLDRRKEGDTYSRKILLTTVTGRVVQFGVVRIHLDYCTETVRQAIVEEKTPLGRVLIQNDVLRRIEPTAFFRIVPDALLTGWFGLKSPTPTYGRLGIIHCDFRPAIDLLEILAPIAE
ncbi:MAG: hypothetical protein K1X57_08600 [Gemmataceae bacterium]|nr:hypothetical protein [Gemmataceae bacterium]